MSSRGTLKGTISESAKKQINKRLEQSSLSDERAQSVIRDVERAVLLSCSMDLPHSPSQAKVELEKLSKAIYRLTYLIKRTSHHANFEMWDAVVESDDPGLPKLDADGFFGSDLAKLRRQAEHIGAAATLALARSKIPRGTPPNVPARHCAHYIAVALRENGIEPSDAPTGLYMSILDILFTDLIPTGTISYLNWGKWALADGMIPESFVDPAYLDRLKK